MWRRVLARPRIVLWLVFIVLAATGLLATFHRAMVLYRVQGSSMEPTLSDGDVLLAHRLGNVAEDKRVGIIPFAQSPEVLRRSDIVVLRQARTHRLLIKRIVALPGDTVAMVSGRIVVNRVEAVTPFNRVSVNESLRGEELGVWHYPFLLPGVARQTYVSTGDRWGPLVMPPRKYFVLSDNRNNRGDSRKIGLVDVD